MKTPTPAISEDDGTARRRELRRLLKVEKQIDCLNPAAFLVMGGLRLGLMLEGNREEELAVLTQAWKKVGEA